MANFKRTNAKIFTKPSDKLSQDSIYWKQLGVPVLLKEFGPINSIDFSPVEPHYFAVSCSARVQIYNPITKQVHKTLSRFRESSYGGTFRADGQLLCSGSEEPVIRLFDVNTKSLLRLFKGHSGPVRRCFFTSDHTHIASFSDDRTARIWDIPTETVVHEFGGHEDYVRAGAVSPISPQVVVSGSYDRHLRMFDGRKGNDAVFKVDHGAPVEATIILPSGGILISAGGNELRVWDLLVGGRLLARVGHHHKTVTCLSLGSNGSRLLSGSLDRHVKIYNVSNYSLVHTLDYSSPILSVGVSANDDTLAVGTVDGIVAVSRREIKTVDDVQKDKPKARYRYAGDKIVGVDSVIQLEKKQIQAKYDTCLRKFQYSKALDMVLMPYITNKSPHVTVSVIQELIRRKGLTNAIVRRSEASLVVLLKFLARFIGDYRFYRTLIDATNIVLDVYEDRLESVSAATFDCFVKVKEKVEKEVQLTKEMLCLGGAIEMLLSSSQAHPAPIHPLPSVTPSANATSVS